MSKEFPRRIKKISSRNNKAAEGEQSSPGGLHFGDYRPRYQETFNIYEKAKNHAREQKKQMNEKNQNNLLTGEENYGKLINVAATGKREPAEQQ